MLFRQIAPLFAAAAIAFPITLAAAEKLENQAFWNSVYKENKVLEIHLSLDRENWDKLDPNRQQVENAQNRGAFENRRPGSSPPRPRPPRDSAEYEYVRASMKINGLSFKDIGLRHKGNSSFFSTVGQLKRPLKIDTNRFVKGQKLYGRTKLNFSNAFKDATFMKEKLGYEVFQAAGFETPGVGWARVTLSVEGLYNRKVVGLYVIVEQVDDNFLERRFGQEAEEGVLMKPEQLFEWKYLGEDLKKYDAYEIKDGKNNLALIKRFADFVKLIEQGSDAQFESQIGKRLDLDLFASYLAANSLLANLDSYVATPHNYYLWTDSRDGVVRLLPWDLNETFGAFPMVGDSYSQATWNIHKPWVSEKRLLTRLFKLDSFKSLYLSKVQKLMAGDFTQKQLNARIDQLAHVLQPWVAKEPTKDSVAAFERSIDSSNTRAGSAPFVTFGNRGPGGANNSMALKQFIDLRINSVNRQLQGKEMGTTLQPRRRGGPGGRPGGNPGFGPPR